MSCDAGSCDDLFVVADAVSHSVYVTGRLYRSVGHQFIYLKNFVYLQRLNGLNVSIVLKALP